MELNGWHFLRTSKKKKNYLFEKAYLRFAYVALIENLKGMGYGYRSAVMNHVAALAMRRKACGNWRRFIAVKLLNFLIR